MKKISVVVLAAVAALACSPLVLAAPVAPAAHHAWHNHARQQVGNEHRLFPEGRQLDLSKAQRHEVWSITRNSFDGLHAPKQAVEQDRLALSKTTPGSSQYEAAANNLAHAAAALTQATVLSRTAALTKIYGLLTPAQKTQFATLNAQWQQRTEWMQAHRQGANG